MHQNEYLRIVGRYWQEKNHVQSDSKKKIRNKGFATGR